KFASRRDGSGWIISTVDSTGEVGRSASLFVNPNNDKPVIAYSDDTNKTVKCAFYQTKGTWRTEVAAKTSGGATYISGNYAAGPGFAIAYFDVANGDLEYASANVPGRWSVRTLAYKRTVGLFNSVVVRDGEAFVYSFGKSAASAFLVSALTPSQMST